MSRSRGARAPGASRALSHAVSGRPRVAVSACLIGEPVRWDGRHKRDEWIAGALGDTVEIIPVCPETELGLGVPREPTELVPDGDGVRMLGVTSRTDHTAAMRALAARRVAELLGAGIVGFVLKSRSPSCALRDAGATGAATTTPGLFAAAVLEHPHRLAVADENDLADPARRGDFVARVLRLHSVGNTTTDDQ